jgi:hypothetical protein
MTFGVGALACLLALLPAVTGGEGPAVRRGDAKAYRFLDDSRRFLKLAAGGGDRTMAVGPWRALPRQADDPALAEPEPRRQVLDATCDADLVLIGRVESSVPFQHPNGRWVLTAHDLVVSRVLRTLVPKVGRLERVRYVHPSGRMTIAGRVIGTTVDRFPPIASDEDGLFFLVRIGPDTYRTSLLLPPMALRGGVLDAFGIVPPEAAREPAAGFSAREAARAAWDAVCRPAPVERTWRPGTSDGRLPPFSGPPPP